MCVLQPEQETLHHSSLLPNALGSRLLYTHAYMYGFYYNNGKHYKGFISIPGNGIHYVGFITSTAYIILVLLQRQYILYGFYYKHNILYMGFISIYLRNIQVLVGFWFFCMSFTRWRWRWSCALMTGVGAGVSVAPLLLGTVPLVPVPLPVVGSGAGGSTGSDREVMRFPESTAAA